jgi:hypothetical protein
MYFKINIQNCDLVRGEKVKEHEKSVKKKITGDATDNYNQTLYM